MKTNRIGIILIGALCLCNSEAGISQRIGRHQPTRRPSMPIQHVPGRPSPSRPYMNHRPPSWGRPPRPAPRPPHFHHSPVYHPRYWYHHPMPYYWGSNWHPVGTFLSTVATVAVATAVADNIATQLSQPVYYSDGVFLQPENNGYVVIAPPIGYGVASLPDNTFATLYNGSTYYYYNGTFYQKRDNQYVVVAPPIGCIVQNLPTDTQEITHEGRIYYYCNGTYYQPVNENNTPAYQVIDHVTEQ